MGKMRGFLRCFYKCPNSWTLNELTMAKLASLECTGYGVGKILQIINNYNAPPSLLLMGLTDLGPTHGFVRDSVLTVWEDKKLQFGL